jgi:hypothetical protein
VPWFVKPWMLAFPAMPLGTVQSVAAGFGDSAATVGSGDARPDVGLAEDELTDEATVPPHADENEAARSRVRTT